MSGYCKDLGLGLEQANCALIVLQAQKLAAEAQYVASSTRRQIKEVAYVKHDGTVTAPQGIDLAPRNGPTSKTFDQEIVSLVRQGWPWEVM